MAKVNPLNERRPTENMAFYGAHGKCPHYSDRERVHLSIEKFRELLNERTKKSSTESSKHAKKSGTDTSEVRKQMRVSFPSLCVNETYTMLGEFGHVPGVEVGDCFSSRAELSLVGLHRPLQAGIDCKDVTFTRKDGNRELLAISLVVSGEYEDDSDQGHTIIYTGQGGKEKGARQHSKDQKSEGGNEALRNSKIRQIPIRVIRGRRVANNKSKVFSYDGLYKVVSYVFEKGQSDFKVFKFTLVRDRDQAPLRPRGQLLLKGGTSRKGAAFGRRLQGDQGGSGEGNICSVVAVGKGVVSDGGKVNIARGGRQEDQVLPSEREEEATAMDIRAATRSQGEVVSLDLIVFKEGDEDKDSILNGQDREKGGVDILPEVLGQSRGIRAKEKADFQDGEITRGAEGEMAKSGHPMGDDETSLWRSKRLRDNSKEEISNGDGQDDLVDTHGSKQPRLGVAIALEGKMQKDICNTSNNLVCSTENLNGELDPKSINIGRESRKHLEDGREVHLVEEMHNKEEEETNDEDIEDGEFEVKSILGKNITKSRRGKRVTNYFVVWKGYPEEEGTWEPITNLTNCKKAIEAFEKSLEMT